VKSSVFQTKTQEPELRERTTKCKVLVAKCNKMQIYQLARALLGCDSGCWGAGAPGLPGPDWSPYTSGASHAFPGKPPLWFYMLPCGCVGNAVPASPGAPPLMSVLGLAHRTADISKKVRRPRITQIFSCHRGASLRGRWTKIPPVAQRSQGYFGR
jgi:hypothetical protein